MHKLGFDFASRLAWLKSDCRWSTSLFDLGATLGAVRANPYWLVLSYQSVAKSVR